MTSREFKYIRNKRFRVVAGSDHVFINSKPGCPICGAKIEITCNEWHYDKWGYIPVSVEIECTRVPEIESSEWDDFMNDHYSQPYSDWLPLQVSIEKLMARKVRFSTLQNKRS